MSAWACSSPSHEGSPVDVHVLDRLERRLEFRRPSDQARVRTVKLNDVCRSCMTRELGTGGPPDRTAPMFGEAL